MTCDLNDQHALVTGAGQGIGEAIARQLLASGARVTVLGRRAEPLQKLVDEQLAKGLQIEDKPVLRRAISTQPVIKPIRVNAPNSVFALGNVFAKS